MTIEILFGAFLIVIYAWERFNTPSTVRTSTTAGRYFAASFIYLLIYLVTYYLFTKYPNLPESIKIDPAILEGLPIEPGDSTPVFIALLLSLMVPKIPLISQIDNRLRRFLHRLAAIPYEAIRLSKEIQQANYLIPPRLRETLGQELIEWGFNAVDIRFDTADPIVQRWLSIASLMLQLKEWEQAHQFNTFIQDRNGEYKRIREHYKRLGHLAQHTFALELQAKEQPELEALQDALSKFRTNLYNEEKAIFAEICDFISHGVLKACFRSGSRNSALLNMGFHNLLSGERTGLSINHSIALFGLLLILLLVNFILLRPTGAFIEHMLLKATMIVSIYSTAVIFAVLPKKHGAFFRYAEGGFYPTLGYLVCGLMAAGTSLGISLFFNALIATSNPEVPDMPVALGEAWSRFTDRSYPWLLMSFATAITLSFLIDWRRLQRLSTGWRRVAEGVMLVLVLGAAVTLVQHWISSLVQHNPDCLAAARDGARDLCRLPDMRMGLSVSAIIGSVLGYLVPTWYRSSAHIESDGSDDDAGAEGGHIELLDLTPLSGGDTQPLHDAT